MSVLRFGRLGHPLPFLLKVGRALILESTNLKTTIKVATVNTVFFKAYNFFSYFCCNVIKLKVVV